MSTPTSVAAEIEQLAREGATPGELLGMLPVPDLRAAIETLDWIRGRGDYAKSVTDKLAVIQLVLQAELDGRQIDG